MRPTLLIQGIFLGIDEVRKLLHIHTNLGQLLPCDHGKFCVKMREGLALRAASYSVSLLSHRSLLFLALTFTFAQALAWKVI